MNDSDSETAGERAPLIDRTSRREFVAAAAATGALAGIGTVALGQDGADIELGGEVDGWTGRVPASIEGTTNPTLELEAGRTYTLAWENLDGTEHDLVIEDPDDNELVATESTAEEGVTRSVTFEATAEMDQYYCEYHPQSMRGEVNVVEARETTTTETTTETTTTAGDQAPYFPRGATVGVQTVAEGLSAPTDFAVADEDADRRYVTDQTGQIYVHGPDGLQSTPFLDISDRLVDLEIGTYDERGLLGVEFHPGYRENRTFYVHYSAPPNEGTPEDYDHVEVVSEFTVVTDADGRPLEECGDPTSERRLLEIPSPQSNHNGGPMAFGPDGYLYVPMGDGGGANDTGPGHVSDWYEANEGGNGQDVTENLLGGVLRIDVDERESSRPPTRSDASEDVDGQGGEKPYAIPEDNPLVGREGLDELYAWGFRNPFGISFDDQGRLFVPDAGQYLFEEVNVVEKGGNYGWNVKEGTHCFSTANPNEPADGCPDRTPDDVRGGEPLLDPVVEYPHEYEGDPVGNVVVGGHVYEGDALPDLEGMYVFGEWSKQPDRPAGRLLAAAPRDEESPDGESGAAQREALWAMTELVVEGADDGRLDYYVRGFGRGGDGALYALVSGSAGLSSDAGAVLKLVPPGGE